MDQGCSVSLLHRYTPSLPRPNLVGSQTDFDRDQQYTTFSACERLNHPLLFPFRLHWFEKQYPFCDFYLIYVTWVLFVLSHLDSMFMVALWVLICILINFKKIHWYCMGPMVVLYTIEHWSCCVKVKIKIMIYKTSGCVNPPDCSQTSDYWWGADSPDLYKDDASCTHAATVVSALPVALMSDSFVHKPIHVALSEWSAFLCHSFGGVRFGAQEPTPKRQHSFWKRFDW